MCDESEAVEDWGRKSFCRQFKRKSATKSPIFVLDVSSPGFRRQLRRVRRLLLLARHVPCLPRFRLGLRLRLQLLVRLTTLRRCGGCHVSLFQFYLSGAGERDTAQSTQRNGPLQHVPNTEAKAALLKTTTSRTLCGMFSLNSAATTIALERATEVLDVTADVATENSIWRRGRRDPRARGPRRCRSRARDPGCRTRRVLRSTQALNVVVPLPQ
jgi:hypothetical protein